MGTKEGGNAIEKKAIVKDEDQKAIKLGRNQDCQNVDGDQRGLLPKKEKFQEACADLQGHQSWNVMAKSGGELHHYDKAYKDLH